jgi:hypothetical protein
VSFATRRPSSSPVILSSAEVISDGGSSMARPAAPKKMPRLEPSATPTQNIPCCIANTEQAINMVNLSPLGCADTVNAAAILSTHFRAGQRELVASMKAFS